jgi:DNA repair exonuclease SbcCD ATPase subunit
VKFRNFLSTGNQFTEIQLDRNPTTLIIGENGSGKSTVLDALCFGLFGKPFRNINKPQLVNSVNNGSCEVEVDFKIGTKSFKVIRGIKPTVFEIYINGKMYNQDANARDYQKYLEQQILKLNYRSFTQVVILGSSTFIPFMQLKARQRRDVVEDILDIQIFSLMNMLLKQKLKTIQEHQRDATYNIDLTTEKITLQNKYIDDVKKNKNKLIKDKVDIISGNEEEIHSRHKKISDLEKANEDLGFNTTHLNDTTEKVQKLKGIDATLKEKRSSTKKYVDFFEKNDDCPTCEQHIDETFKENMIVTKKGEHDKFDSGILKLSDELKRQEDLLEAINNYIGKIRENDAEIGKITFSIKEMEKFNTTLQSEIVQLQSGEISKEDMDKLKKLKKSLKSYEKQQHGLREDQSYAEAARSMLMDTGIKTKIIKQYLPIMNKLINTYLTAMEFYVNFTLNENFIETIKSRHRDEFTYASFSEGEKMRIDLALLFTWRAIAKMKNSTNTNLLILDEIFDSSLDSTGTDEFLKILNTLDNENIFVISHKQDVLVDKFKSTIRFHKVKNFSHVAE